MNSNENVAGQMLHDGNAQLPMRVSQKKMNRKLCV